jgi:hypothetical protein
MRYLLICQVDPQELSNAVNALLRAGWALHGNLQVVSTHGNYLDPFYFVQAMVKYGKD